MLSILPMVPGCEQAAVPVEEENLPVVVPREHPERLYHRVRNLVRSEDIRTLVSEGTDSGFALDASHIHLLQDGSRVNPRRIYGRCYYGPYAFESGETAYRYSRLRLSCAVEKGRGFVKAFLLLEPRYNSNDWQDEGELLLRFALREKKWGIDRDLGTYDMRLRFRKEDTAFVRLSSIVEGPSLNAINSLHPDSVVISLETDTEVRVRVVLSNGAGVSSDTPARRHLIPIAGLQPGSTYSYHVEIDGDSATPSYSFTTAPPAGEGRVVFAYAGDSREGVGAGEKAFMGVNREALVQLLSIAYHKGAAFFAMGGDLMNGYTTVAEDFEMQLDAFKSAVAAFRSERCVYPAMGNHETLLRYFADGTRNGITLDRWPYATESAEYVFMSAFVNPSNAPTPSDSRRPTYTGNCCTYDYGPVRMIVFNNNYWYANKPEITGGCPEGYILDDQLRWIEARLNAAEQDSNIRYVLLYAQEPVFPCGGHAKDAMWYNGNNGKRAWVRDRNDGRLKPEDKGIIEVRNELASMVAACRKVAAVLGSDEHAYYRILIDKNVPIGIPGGDDTGGDTLCREGAPCRSLSTLRYPVWYITSGGAGAPYYSEEALPWNTYRKAGEEYPGQYYYFSSQSHVILFDANEKGIGCTVYNRFGEAMDSVADLMAVKRDVTNPEQ